MDVPTPTIDTYCVRAHQRLEALLEDPRIEADLRPELLAYWRMVGGDASQAIGSPTGLFMMVALSEGAQIDDTMLDVAAGCELYIVAISVFDAIADRELEGSLAALPEAVATNAALIMFVQAVDAIERLADARPELRSRVRACVQARSLTSGAGQHRDLCSRRPASIDEAVAIARDKTAAIPMTAELAAIASGCNPDRVASYATIAECSALIRQCANDLRDVYGKNVSDDLRDGKWNVPYAAFWSAATEAQREEFGRLRDELPGSMDRLRQLVFETGAVREVALVIERARREIHAHLDNATAPIALVGRLADATARSIYATGDDR